MSTPRSGLVAVLFTDLVGSTELMSQLGDRASDDLRRRHFAALGKAVAAHGGEEVKNTGDGLMAVFLSAAEAVEAAVAVQQATASQVCGWSRTTARSQMLPGRWMASLERVEDARRHQVVRAALSFHVR